MRKLLLASAGALVLSLAAGQASAQDLSAPSAPDQGGGETRYFLAHSIPFNGEPPRSIRDIREVSEDSVIVEERWFQQRYPGAQAEFNAGHRVSANLCRTTGVRLREAERLIGIFAMFIPVFADLYRELEGLRGEIDDNSFWRRVFEVIGIIAGAATGGAGYGVVVGANAGAYEGGAMVNDNALDLNTRISMANVLASIVNMESNILNLNVLSDYLLMMDEACGTMGMDTTPLPPS